MLRKITRENNKNFVNSLEIRWNRIPEVTRSVERPFNADGYFATPGLRRTHFFSNLAALRRPFDKNWDRNTIENNRLKDIWN